MNLVRYLCCLLLANAWAAEPPRLVAEPAIHDLATLMAEGLAESHPGIRLDLLARGEALAELASGRADAALLRGSPTAVELGALGDGGGAPLLVMGVGREVLEFVVHEDNPIHTRGLSLAELEAIIGVKRRRGHPEAITRWGQLGLEGAWAETRIRVETTNSAGQAYGLVKTLLLQGGDLRQDARAASGSGVVPGNLRELLRDPACLTWTMRANVASLPPQLTTVPILPADDAQALVQHLCIIVPATAPAPLPERTLSILSWALGRQGNQAVHACGYSPLETVHDSRPLSAIVHFPGPQLQIPPAAELAQVMLDPALPDFTPGPALEGSLMSNGHDDTNNLLTRLAEGLLRHQPQLTVEIEGRGNSRIRDFLARKDEFMLVVRPPNEGEMAQLVEAFGQPPLMVPIAHEILMIVVHPSNSLAQRGLTLAEVDAIFSAERRRGHSEALTHWGQLGLEGEWAQRPIARHGHSVAGIVSILWQAALQQGPFHPEIHEEPRSTTLRQAVAADPGTIGYLGEAYLDHTVAVVPLRAAAEAPLHHGPAEQALPLEAYPLHRFRYALMRHDASPAARELLRFTLSRQGQHAVRAEGLRPLDAAAAQAGLDAMNQP